VAEKNKQKEEEMRKNAEFMETWNQMVAKKAHELQRRQDKHKEAEKQTAAFVKAQMTASSSSTDLK
jgi:hypothetical protein